MFEGDDDDDFSFIDEDFLAEAFQPSDSGNVISKKSPALNENCKKTVTDLGKNVVSDGKSKFSTSDSRDNSEKQSYNLQRTIVTDNGKDISGINPTVKKSDVVCGQAEKDNNFEFDYFFDSFDTEDDFNTSVQSTPPDSEFTKVSVNQPHNQVRSTQKNNLCSLASENSNKRTDFRARILQSLQENKHVNDLQNNERPSHSNSKSSLSGSSFCVAKAERKKRAISEEDEGSSNKRFQILPVDQHCMSEGHLSQESEQDFQSFSSFITPLKPSPGTVRKSASPGGPVIQKRKFPGPAGILPQLGSKATLPSVQHLDEKEQSSSVRKDIVCSQSSADDFVRGPWRQMLDDLELEQPHHSSPLLVFNIKWVLRRAGLRGQAGVRKVPFLAVMVRNIDATHLDATVIVKDETGEMSGTVSNSVLEEYGHTLQPGCVLLLKDVTLLSPVGLKTAVGGREPSRHHYLNVTLNTILTLYSSDEAGHVITTTVCDVDKKELFDRAAAFNMAIAPRAIVEEEEEEAHSEIHAQKQALFSNIKESYGGSPIHYNQYNQNSNYRFPRTNVPPQPNNLQQQQKFRYNSPVTNSPRIGSQSATFSPRAGASNVIGLIRSQRFPSPSPQRFSSPSPQRFPSPSPSPQRFPSRPPQSFPSPSQLNAGSTSSRGSFRVSVGQPGKTFNNSNFRSDSQTLPSKKTLFCSQEEEKEVSDLLDSVDTDSLFGDF